MIIEEQNRTEQNSPYRCRFRICIDGIPDTWARAWTYIHVVSFLGCSSTIYMAEVEQYNGIEENKNKAVA